MSKNEKFAGVRWALRRLDDVGIALGTEFNFSLPYVNCRADLSVAVFEHATVTSLSHPTLSNFAYHDVTQARAVSHAGAFSVVAHGAVYVCSARTDRLKSPEASCTRAVGGRRRDESLRNPVIGTKEAHLLRS